MENLTIEGLNIYEQVDALMKQYGVLSKYIYGYQERIPQIEAVKKAIETFEEGKHFLFEGPTGFGKSPTYLTAAMLMAANYGKRAVVATSGITLQEQLYYKDAPAIAKAIKELLNINVSFAHIKGRNNFLCLRKLDSVVTNTADVYLSSYDEQKELSDLIAWSKTTKTGDLSELSYVPQMSVMKEIACLSSNDCARRQCEFYDRCYYQRTKTVASTANLVITNYHLLFSDINVGKKILGNYDILVCDEAHDLAKISRDFNEIKVTYYSIMQLAKDMSAAFNKLEGNKFYNKKDIDTSYLQNVCEVYFANLSDYFRSLPQYLTFFKYEMEKVSFVRKGLNIPYEDMRKALSGFSSDLEDYIQQKFGGLGEDDEITEEELFAYNTFNATFDKAVNLSRGIKEIALQENPDRCYWIEKEGNGSVGLHSKPIKVDKYLGETIFGEASGIKAIITSATMSVGESFDYIKRELGLTDVGELIADSPFDLEKQQLWYLPENAVEANEPNFFDVSIKNISEIIDVCGGGVLCLFTSVKNMKEAYAYLKPRHKEYNIFMQGQKPRQQLLVDFKEDEHSVLLGTKSFFTGIDIKGSALRCVCIDKFPFESPGDPVTIAIGEIMGRDAFFRYSIPDMVITLKQAIGRGVRGTDDKCVIALMDNRMATARYKGTINKSFNYIKTTTRKIDDVKTFVKEYMDK